MRPSPRGPFWRAQSDATMSSLFEGAALAREYPDLQMIFADRPRNPIPMAFVAPLNDPAFTGFLNSWIVIRQASGFFDEVATRWGIVSA